MRHVLVRMAAATVLAGLTALASAQERNHVRVGTLRCVEAYGWDLVFSSSHDLKCVFSGVERRAKHVRFTGEIKRYGVDIGFQENAVILWAVTSASGKFTPGAIAGKYAGATAEAAWAVGLGVNVLVGGSRRGVALQPISIEGFDAVNLAAGLAEVELKPAK